MIKWLLLALIIAYGIFYVKSCRQNTTEVQETNSGIQIPKLFWTPTVTIKPTIDSSNVDGHDKTSLRETANGTNSPNESLVHNEQNGDSGGAIVSTGTGNNIQQMGEYAPIVSLPTRPGNILWSRSNGSIRWNWYGLSLSPGVNYQTEGQKRGLGIDIRWLYIGDFSTQAGFAFYKEEKVKPQISIGYNLRRTKWLSNVDVIAGINLDKTLFGGLRVELGQYWR